MWDWIRDHFFEVWFWFGIAFIVSLLWLTTLSYLVILGLLILHILCWAVGLIRSWMGRMDS